MAESNCKWGDKVKTTQEAIDKHIFSEHRKGICLGWFGITKTAIYVICENQVTPRTYHRVFWKKVK